MTDKKCSTKDAYGYVESQDNHKTEILSGLFHIGDIIVNLQSD